MKKIIATLTLLAFMFGSVAAFAQTQPPATKPAASGEKKASGKKKGKKKRGKKAAKKATSGGTATKPPSK